MTLQPPCQTHRNPFGSLDTYSRFAMLILAIIVCLPVYGGCRPAGDGTETVHFLVAASAKDATEAAVDLFLSELPLADRPRIVIASGASSSLAQQILAGAPADIFISASLEWSDAVANQNTDVSPLLSNRLVLATNADNSGNFNSIDDLLQSHVKSIAVAGKNVPVGSYANEFIEQLSESQQQSIGSRLVFAKDSSALVAWLENNEVDAAFVYSSDLKRSSKLKLVKEIDQSLHSPIVYSIVSLADAGDRHPLADQLCEWLETEKARAIYREAGFETESLVFE